MMFRFQQHVAVPVQLVAAFYSSVENLLRISPPFPRLRIEDADRAVRAGRKIPMSLDLFVARFKWQSVIESVEEGRSFTDTMRGRFVRSWRHVHRFEQRGKNTLLTDEIVCDVPWWLAGIVWLGVRLLFLYRRVALAGALE